MDSVLNESKEQRRIRLSKAAKAMDWDLEKIPFSYEKHLQAYNSRIAVLSSLLCVDLFESKGVVPFDCEQSVRSWDTQEYLRLNSEFFKDIRFSEYMGK